MAAQSVQAGATVGATQLLADLARAADVVFADSPVFLAYVFGSRVWGEPRANSDVDVGYYALQNGDAHCLSLVDELGYAGQLSDALGLEVDLRCLGAAPLALRGRVLEQGRRVFCSDQVARVNLERELLGQYLDYKPKLDALRELRFAALAGRS